MVRRVVHSDIFTGTFIFSLLFITRYLIAPDIILGGFHFDDLLDACIKPWQWSHGLAIEGEDTNVLFFALFSFWYSLVGFHQQNAQLLSILLFSASLTGYALAIRRISSLFSCWVFAGIVLCFLPFLVRPAFVTTALSGLWIPSLLLLLYSRAPSALNAFLLGALTPLSLLLYTSGALVTAGMHCSLLFFFPTRWRSYGRSFLGGLLSGGILFFLCRVLPEDAPALSHWGVYDIDLSQFSQAFGILVHELLFSADSWMAFSGGRPYLTKGFIFVLAGGALRSVFVLARKRHHDQKGGEYRWARWYLVFLCSNVAGIIGASFVSHLPGVRRVLPSVVMLFLAGVVTLQMLRIRYPRLALITAIVLIGEQVSISSVELPSMVFHSPKKVQPLTEAALTFVRGEKTPRSVLIALSSARNREAVQCGLALDQFLKSSPHGTFSLDISRYSSPREQCLAIAVVSYRHSISALIAPTSSLSCLSHYFHFEPIVQQTGGSRHARTFGIVHGLKKRKEMPGARPQSALAK
ncbi:hypothetical protein MRY87_12980 [bacterium]|nr:hypothetical protein [bacterium]